MLRLANEGDFKNVLRLAEKFHKESPFSSLTFEESKLREMFSVYLQDKSKIIIILSEQDEKVVGMIVGVSSEIPFSIDICALELAWYMEEEFRRSRDSLDLLKAYEEWAKRIGATVCQMSMLSNSPPLEKLYERMSFNYSEKTFTKFLEVK